MGWTWTENLGLIAFSDLFQDAFELNDVAGNGNRVVAFGSWRIWRELGGVAECVPRDVAAIEYEGGVIGIFGVAGIFGA